MGNVVRIAPPNSLVLIEDRDGGVIPDSMNQSLVAVTDSCIAVGCRAEDDGETEIILGVSASLDIGGYLVFEGCLRTPSKRVVVRNVLGDTLLEAPALATKTQLKIWANDLTEPDRIVVEIDVRGANQLG